MDARSSKIANKRLALEIFFQGYPKTTAGSYVFGVLDSGPPETFRKPRLSDWVLDSNSSWIANPFDPSNFAFHFLERLF